MTCIHLPLPISTAEKVGKFTDIKANIFMAFTSLKMQKSKFMALRVGKVSRKVVKVGE